jgi:hypothetical protein
LKELIVVYLNPRRKIGVATMYIKKETSADDVTAEKKKETIDKCQRRKKKLVAF